MNSELAKSLNALIDETLEELEELKKSRFSAAEIKIEGPGADGIAGKPANGDLHAKAEKKEDEKEEDKDEEKKEDKAEKAEGKNAEADPDGGKHKMDKAEDKAEKAEGKNSESDPDAGKHKMDKAEKKEDKKEDKKDEKDEDEDKKMEMKMKKSQEEMTYFMKSFVDEKIKPLEDKLSTIVDLVNKLADQPVAPKGATARVAPLMKSGDESFEPMTKSQVTSKLLELKKSGTPVDSLDVTKAEMGQDLESISKKYKIS